MQLFSVEPVGMAVVEQTLPQVPLGGGGAGGGEGGEEGGEAGGGGLQGGGGQGGGGGCQPQVGQGGPAGPTGHRLGLVHS